MTSYYRIYCVTEGGFQYEWRDTPPTVCPNDVGHTVNDNSISELNVDHKNIDLTIGQTFKAKNLSTSIFTEISSFIYPGSTTYGHLKKVEITFSMPILGEQNNTDFGFYFRIRDFTNNTTIYDSPKISGGDRTLTYYNDSIATNCPSSESMWCIVLKKGEKSGNIYIRHITLHFYKV